MDLRPWHQQSIDDQSISFLSEELVLVLSEVRQEAIAGSGSRG